MATTGEGSYEGGAGGKYRKKPLRRIQTTPYDRPSTAIRRTSEAGRTTWLLNKLVQPAYRIISASAQSFLSSLWSNPRALPSVRDGDHEVRNDPVAVSHIPSEAKEPVSNEGDTLHNSSDTIVLNDLEQILRQKTFTRAEIDRLTELLRSRTVDPSTEDKRRSETSASQLVAAHGGKGSVPAQGTQSPPTVVGSRFLTEDSATPRELAVAFMENRVSNITPSKLGLHSQTCRDDAALLTNVPFAKRSPSMALVPAPAFNFNSSPRVSGNGSVTPGHRGRSALHNMARSPYTRVHQSTAHKTAKSKNERNGGPSASLQWLWENNIHSGGKQVSKRRSSVLESDIGSIGPIRRIRQKTVLTPPPKNLSLRSPGSSSLAGANGSELGHGPMPPIQKSLQHNEIKHNSLNLGLVENVNNLASTSFASVPSQSRKSASRILETLETLVRSPNGKSPELKLEMIRGKALRSLVDVDSMNLRGSDVSGDSGNNHGVNARETSKQQSETSHKQVNVHENGPNKISALGGKLDVKENGKVSELSIQDNRSSAKTVDPVISCFSSIPSQKKRGFQMSAHEDSLELDEDSISSRDVTTPFATDKGKGPLVEANGTVTDTITAEKPLVSSSEITPSASVLGQRLSVAGSSNTSPSPTLEKDSGLSFTIAHSSIAIPEPAAPVKGSASLKESTDAPVSGFFSKSADKATPFTFSSTSVNESLIPKFSLQSETSGSGPSENATSAKATLGMVESDIGIKSETQKPPEKKGQNTGDMYRKEEQAAPAATSASTTTLFSFAAPTSNSSLDNGSLASSSSLLSIPAPPSDKSGNSFFSTGTATADKTSSLIVANILSPTAEITKSGPVAISSLAVPLQFKSTTLPAPSTSASLPQTASVLESTSSELKTKHTSSPFTFGGTASALSSASSSNFVFGVSSQSSAKPSSPINNLFQSSNTSVAASSGSLFSSQASSGAAIAPSTSMPLQFSSSPSPSFGSSGSSFSSGNSVFGSASGSKMFGSSSTFGTAFSMSSSSFSSSSSASGIFTSQSTPTSSIFTFGSTSSTTPFGASSAASAAVGSASIFAPSFGGSSSSAFSFNAATSSAPNSSPFSVFSTPNTPGTFSQVSQSNDQMEDSMAEDTMQASTPVLGFGQAASLPPANLTFGSPAPSNLFQMNGQQTPATQQNPFAPAITQSPSPFGTTATQNPSPFGTTPTQNTFQASGSLGVSAEGGFSLGTGGGGDKSNRRIIKVRRQDRPRKR